MNLKTYRARSMAECLTEVKKDLGRDAVILRTRSYRVGGVLGVGGRQMVEITASGDAPPPGMTRHRRRPTADDTASRQPGVDHRAEMASESATAIAEPPARPASRHSAVRAYADQGSPTPGGDAPEPGSSATLTMDPPSREPARSASGFRETRFREADFAQPDPRETTLPEIGTRAGSESLRSLATRVTPNPQSQAAIDALHEELGAIKKMVGQVLCASRSTVAHRVVESGGMPDPLFDLFRTLTDQQLDASLADRVLASTRDELTPGELTDDAITRATLTRHLSKMIPTDPAASDPSAATARVIALMGPTGVGKTTTIAKLAATLKLRRGLRVGLLTCDTYRIAAVDQLRVYADIIGLPLKVAQTPADAARQISALDDCDVILVDTAGRSPSDDMRLDELSEYLGAIQPDETHLVLSLASAENVMARAAERFGRLRPSRLLFTKLDEAVALGPLVNTANMLALPISYLTTGQEVPDHFEPASADRLARAILAGGSLRRNRESAA